MTDNITLPREVVEQLLKMLEMVDPYADQFTDYSSTAAEWPLNLLPKKVSEAITALRTALAAPKQEHPGYVIGSHWLETAYSRICAGEAEADVLRDCGWERVDDAEALRRDAERYRWLRNRACHGPHERFVAEYGWFDVSGQHEPGFDAAIDAAMKEGT